MLFGPLVVIVILQFASDENRYIKPQEATRIALEAAAVDEAPVDLEITFDESPAARHDTSATWDVFYEKPGDPRYIDVLIDAETGDVLLVGSRG
ncbi:MAG: PepSY domain-containing protein [Actinomycetota bacterium]|nr:PepSY domain-containing protein [Actinomycetota bacterium]